MACTVRGSSDARFGPRHRDGRCLNDFSSEDCPGAGNSPSNECATQTPDVARTIVISHGNANAAADQGRNTNHSQ